MGSASGGETACREDGKSWINVSWEALRGCGGDNGGGVFDGDCVKEGVGDERIRGRIIRGAWLRSPSLELNVDLG